MNSKWMLLFCSVWLHVSAADMSKAFKLLNAGEYDKAKQLFREELQEDSRSAAANFGLAKLYASHDNKAFNLDSASYFIQQAQKQLPFRPDDKQTKKLSALGVREFTIQALFKQINKEAFQLAESKNTAEGYDHFAQFFTDEILVANAIDQRDILLLEQLQKNKQLSETKDFLNRYPKSKKFAEANELYEKLLYEETTRDQRWESYLNYFTLYPTAPYAAEAKRLYQQKLWESYRSKNTLEAYQEFEKKYFDNPFSVAAQDSIYSLVTRDKLPDNYNYFIQNFTGNKHIDDAWLRLYALYTPHAVDSEYLFFQKIYPQFPFPEKLKRDIELSRTELIPFKQGMHYGYINTATQQLQIAPQFQEAYPFSGGLAAVATTTCTDTCYYQYITKEGQLLIPTKYASAGDFYNGKAIVASNYCNGSPCQFGVINRFGEYLIPPIYLDLEPLSEGLHAAHNDKGYGFIDESNNIIIPFVYRDAISFNEGLAVVKNDSGWCFIDRKGVRAFPIYFKSASGFSNGLAAVSSNDSTYGYIDKTGAYVIAPIYDYAEPFEGDTAIVSLKETNKKSKEYGLLYRLKIDRTGKIYYRIGEVKLPATKPKRKKK